MDSPPPPWCTWRHEQDGHETEATTEQRIGLLERRTARAAQLERSLAHEAATLTAQLQAAIISRKTTSEAAIKSSSGTSRRSVFNPFRTTPRKR